MFRNDTDQGATSMVMIQTKLAQLVLKEVESFIKRILYLKYDIHSPLYLPQNDLTVCL